MIWRWNWQSNPFGETLPDENPDGDGQLFALNLRFPGQYFDAESGLHQNGFRDYEAGTGRYIESDPIGLEGGLNTYIYAHSVPLGFVDPKGLADTTVTSWCRQYPADCAAMMGAAAGAALTVPKPIADIRANCKEDEPDCKRATPFHLARAGIGDPEAFKAEYVGTAGGKFDICACKDGSIQLKAVGQCGMSGPGIPTGERWQ